MPCDEPKGCGPVLVPEPQRNHHPIPTACVFATGEANAPAAECLHLMAEEGDRHLPSVDTLHHMAGDKSTASLTAVSRIQRNHQPPPTVGVDTTLHTTFERISPMQVADGLPTSMHTPVDPPADTIVPLSHGCQHGAADIFHLIVLRVGPPTPQIAGE